MNRRLPRFAMLLSAALTYGSTATAADERMNLVLIVADDLATWALPAYGNRDIETPHIDRLAAEGFRFTHAFSTSPVCTPARAQLVTGLETIQLGTLNDPTSGADMGSLPPGAPSWARELQRAGYSTAHVGKWHLGYEPEHAPTRHGYDYFYGFRTGSNLSKDPFLARGEKPHRRVEGFTDDLLTDEAIRWIGEQADERADEPFLLSLALRAPHLPYRPMPPQDEAAIENVHPESPELGDPRIAGVGEDYRKFLASERRDYLANVHTVDRNIGRLLAALEQRRLLDRTIIILTSDNGYLLGERGLFNKGPAAPIQYYMYPDNRLLWAINLWDLSIRVPMIVRWPGVDRTVAEPAGFVSLIDLYRSILGMLEVPISAESPVGGADFSALLRDPGTPWRDAIFGQYTSDRIGNTEFLRMIRTERWKLVRAVLNPSASRLYDLQNDPGELNNLYRPALRLNTDEEGNLGLVHGEDTHADIRERLEARLLEWQRSVNDPALELEKVYREHKERALRRWDLP